MFLSTSILSTLVLAGAALAQYGSDSGYGSDSSYGSGSSGSGSSGSGGSDSSSSMSMTASPASSPAASAGTATPSGMIPLQVVKVSNKEGTLKFYPDSFDMAAGSMVQFQFYPKVCAETHATFAPKGSAVLTVSAYRIIVSFDLLSISHVNLSRTTTQALSICFQGSCRSNQRIL